MNEYFVERRECPCCESNETHELCRVAYSSDAIRNYLETFYAPQGGVEFEYLQDQDYVLRECTTCELIYQSEIPNDFLMGKVYGEWIDPEKCFEYYEKPRNIQHFSNLSTEIVGIIGFLGQQPRELKFLDYSMGWGHWARIAQSFGCVVHGTEYSRSRIDFAKSTGVHVIDQTEIAAHRYDFINTEQVFEHLPDVRSTLSYLSNCLKPGGILKISVPNGRNTKQLLAKWNWSVPKGSTDSLNTVAPLEHINCFKRSTLILLAASCDLVPIDQSQIEKTWTLPRNVMGILKTILRPCWYWIKGVRRHARNQETYILFKRANP